MCGSGVTCQGWPVCGYRFRLAARATIFAPLHCTNWAAGIRLTSPRTAIFRESSGAAAVFALHQPDRPGRNMPALRCAVDSLLEQTGGSGGICFPGWQAVAASQARLLRRIVWPRHDNLDPDLDRKKKRAAFISTNVVCSEHDRCSKTRHYQWIARVLGCHQLQLKSDPRKKDHLDRTQKSAPRGRIRLIRGEGLVAGVGFEPTTFRL